MLATPGYIINRIKMENSIFEPGILNLAKKKAPNIATANVRKVVVKAMKVVLNILSPMCDQPTTKLFQWNGASGNHGFLENC
jgi:hypothetical protein